MDFMEILRFLHSWTRWAVVLVAIVLLVYLIMGLVQSRPWTKPGRGLMTAFSSLIGLQWVIGLVFLIVWGAQIGFGNLPRHVWEHLTATTLALIAAHVHYSWARKELPDRTRFTRNLAVVIVTLVLVIVGITALQPALIQWRFYTGM